MCESCFIPEDCLIIDIVSILKCKNKDATNVGNYRPIAVATTISKLFEHFILFHIKPFLSTSDHQFGFKRGTGTDMCIFLLKQIISSYLQQGSPIFSVFLDASKAFDRVSHELLFKKLLLHDVPPCFIRLLRYWYRQQQMRVRWGSQLSQSFGVSNGVRQWGILSPYLFAVYIDQLSKDLNRVPAGCYIGNTLVNHIIYADDICCFSPSVAGLQDLLAVCDSFSCKNRIVFNSNKSQCMQFFPKSFPLTNVPVVRLCNETLNLSKKVKYLGVYLTNALTDDDDINRQVRSLYCSANQLKSAFSHCSFDVKNLLFKSYCTNFYGSHLWSNYLKSSFHSIRVAYNDCYRMLHNLPRYTSAREFQVIHVNM